MGRSCGSARSVVRGGRSLARRFPWGCCRVRFCLVACSRCSCSRPARRGICRVRARWPALRARPAGPVWRGAGAGRRLRRSARRGRVRGVGRASLRPVSCHPSGSRWCRRRLVGVLPGGLEVFPPPRLCGPLSVCGWRRARSVVRARRGRAAAVAPGGACWLGPLQAPLVGQGLRLRQVCPSCAWRRRRAGCAFAPGAGPRPPPCSPGLARRPRFAGARSAGRVFPPPRVRAGVWPPPARLPRPPLFSCPCCSSRFPLRRGRRGLTPSARLAPGYPGCAVRPWLARLRRFP